MSAAFLKFFTAPTGAGFISPYVRLFYPDGGANFFSMGADPSSTLLLVERIDALFHHLIQLAFDSLSGFSAPEALNRKPQSD